MMNKFDEIAKLITIFTYHRSFRSILSSFAYVPKTNAYQWSPFSQDFGEAIGLDSQIPLPWKRLQIKLKRFISNRSFVHL